MSIQKLKIDNRELYEFNDLVNTRLQPRVLEILKNELKLSIKEINIEDFCKIIQLACFELFILNPKDIQNKKFMFSDMNPISETSKLFFGWSLKEEDDIRSSIIVFIRFFNKNIAPLFIENKWMLSIEELQKFFNKDLFSFNKELQCIDFLNDFNVLKQKKIKKPNLKKLKKEILEKFDIDLIMLTKTQLTYNSQKHCEIYLNECISLLNATR